MYLFALKTFLTETLGEESCLSMAVEQSKGGIHQR